MTPRRGEPAPGGGEPVSAVPWPAVGSRVLLSAPGKDPRATRVADTADGALAVAVPRAGRGELEPPLDGAPFELAWPGHRGLLVVPVVLRERVRERVPLWWLEPVGPVAVQQRRSFVRAAVDAPFPVRVSLEWEVPERGTAAGELADLSEGGLRAHVRPPAGAVPGATPGAGPEDGRWATEVPEGAGVSVRMTLVGIAEEAGRGASGGSGVGSGVDVVEHELFGTVLRAGRLPEAPETTEVVVQLHDDAPQSDSLRRLVFAWQRRARQR